MAAKSIPILIADIKHDYKDVREVHLDKFNWDVKSGFYRVKIWNVKGFREFCKAVWENISGSKSRRMIVVFDEVSRYVKNNSLDKFPNFSDMLTLGRAYGIGMWHCVQRPALVDKSVLSQSKYIISFKMDLELDLNAVRSWIKPERVQALGLYHFLLYDDENGVSEHEPV